MQPALFHDLTKKKISKKLRMNNLFTYATFC